MKFAVKNIYADFYKYLKVKKVPTKDKKKALVIVVTVLLEQTEVTL